MLSIVTVFLGCMNPFLKSLKADGQGVVPFGIQSFVIGSAEGKIGRSEGPAAASVVHRHKAYAPDVSIRDHIF